MSADFSAFSGWISRYADDGPQPGWSRCWGVVHADAVICFEGEDQARAVIEYALSSTARVLVPEVADGEDVPAGVLQRFEGHPFGFILRRDVDVDEDEKRGWACFDTSGAVARAAWCQAIEEAAGAPRHLDVYIDDFSDVEDDEHVRRSSFANLDDWDWCQVHQADDPAHVADEERSLCRSSCESVDSTELPADSSAQSPEASPPWGRALSSSSSKDEVNSQSSFVQTHCIDWTAVAQDPGFRSEGHDVNEEADKDGEHQFLPEDTVVQGAFERVFGECF